MDWFEYEDKGHPLSNAPEPKRRFIPSKWEAKKVSLSLSLHMCVCVFTNA